MIENRARRLALFLSTAYLRLTLQRTGVRIRKCILAFLATESKDKIFSKICQARSKYPQYARSAALHNSTDDEETAREIEEEWHPDDNVRLRGNLVYTMPEVSAESRRREHRRNERINYFPEN